MSQSDLLPVLTHIAASLRRIAKSLEVTGFKVSGDIGTSGVSLAVDIPKMIDAIKNDIPEQFSTERAIELAVRVDRQLDQLSDEESKS